MPDKTTDGVVVHSPDPAEYQGLDDAQARVLGDTGTVIPTHTKRKATKAKPVRTVFIDAANPLTGEGGIVIDLNDIDAKTHAEAVVKAEAAGLGDDGSMAAYEFIQGVQNAEGTGDPEEAPPVAPDPKAAEEAAVEIAETLPEAEPSSDNVNLRDVMLQQGQMLSLLSQMVQGTNSPKPEIKEEEEPVEQEIQEVELEQEIEESAEEAMMPKREAVDLLNGAFAELKIPGLEPVPAKPKFRVIFNLGDAGTHTAWYHWVGKHNNGLFLIYDTRFEYGMQYIPPNLGAQRSIKVDIPSNDASYNVYSLDFVHPFGVFDIINLVVADEPQAGAPSTTMNDFDASDYNELDADLMKQIM
jgi:hypothetical protein